MEHNSKGKQKENVKTVWAGKGDVKNSKREGRNEVRTRDLKISRFLTAIFRSTTELFVLIGLTMAWGLEGGLKVYRAFWVGDGGLN